MNSASDLTISRVTIDILTGGSEVGHSTDGFDIGDSTGVTITNTVGMSQDDFGAIKSYTVCEAFG